MDEEPLLHRLGWQRRAVGSGDRRFPVLPREQHRQRARSEGGIGDDQSLAGCGAVPRSPEVRQRRVTHGRCGAHDPLQLRNGVLVDLGDGGAGDDVVELIEQERLPGGLDLIVRIGEPGELGDGREGFGFEEPVLAGTVEGLRAGLGSQRAAVELQVELPHPDRQTRFRQRGEKLLDVRHAQAWQRRELPDARVVLEHARRWPAAAVTPAEGEQTFRVLALAPEVAPRAEGVERGDIAVVAMGRRQIAEHVGRHPAAVDPFPGEEVVGEEVLFVPVELGREEAVDPGASQELGNPAREPEDVRQPRDRRAFAEPGFEGALPVEELADERLAAGDLGVWLDPRAADRLPAALGDALLDPLQEIGGVLLDPGVELRR